MRAHDDEENAATTPPEGEHIRYRCLWTVELYTPSRIGGLVDGIRRVGLDRDQFGTRDVAAWIAKGRTTGGAGYWNGGTFVPKGTQRAFAAQIPMPECFQWLQPSFHQLPSGVTALTINWAIAESHVSLIEDALRAPAASEIYDLGDRSEQFATVSNVKSARVAAGRAAILESARSWVAENLPGFFTGDADGRLPAWEFITTTSASMWGEIWPGPARDWRTAAGLDAVEVWESGGYQNLGLCFMYSGGQAAHSLAVFTGVEDGLIQTLDKYRPPDIYGYIGALGEGISSLVVEWALCEGAVTTSRRLARIADATAPPGKGKASVDAVLGLLNADVLPLGHDADVLRRVGELLETTEGAWFYSGVPAFTYLVRPTPPGLGAPIDPGETMFERLRHQLTEHSEAAAANVGATRDALRTRADVLLAVTNLRLQRWLLRLTVAAVVIALGAAGVSVVALNHS